MTRMIARRGWIVMLSCLMIGMVAAPVGAVYQVGDYVANFTLPDAQGTNVSLYDYQDRIVLLAFWFYT